jgi:hypothetical protein
LPKNGTSTFTSPSMTNETSPAPERVTVPVMPAGWPMTLILTSARRAPSPSGPPHRSVCLIFTESPTNFLMESGMSAGWLRMIVTV